MALWLQITLGIVLGGVVLFFLAVLMELFIQWMWWR